jgi:MFS family permease
MEKQTIIKLVIPLVLLSSVYSGIFYNLAIWLKDSILETYWSFFITSSTFTATMTITFIIFTIVLLLSIYYVDKIIIKPVIVVCVILIGFCSIYISFTTTIEWFFLYYFLMALSIAYLTPCLMKLAKDKIPSEKIEGYQQYIYYVTVIAWIVLSVLLFESLGNLYPASSWRMLYLVTGIINVASAPLIIIL